MNVDREPGQNAAGYRIVTTCARPRSEILAEAVRLHDTRWFHDYDEFWDCLANNRRISAAKHHNRRGIVAALEKRFRKDQTFSVLDAGCGEGSLLAMIESRFPNANLIGVDVSQRALDLASEITGATLIRLDLENERIDARFDVVIANETLQFVKDDRRVLDNLANMCSDTIVALVYDVDIEQYPECRYWGEYRTYDARENLDGKLEEVGFQIVCRQHRGFPFHSIYQWLLIRRDVFPLRRQVKTSGIAVRLVNLLLRLLYYGNVFPSGQRLIVTARKAEAR